MKYKVVNKNDLYDLEESVEKHLREGWRCQGGIFWARYSYYQAMVKED